MTVDILDSFIYTSVNIRLQASSNLRGMYESEKYVEVRYNYIVEMSHGEVDKNLQNRRKYYSVIISGKQNKRKAFSSNHFSS